MFLKPDNFRAVFGLVFMSFSFGESQAGIRAVEFASVFKTRQHSRFVGEIIQHFSLQKEHFFYFFNPAANCRWG